MTESEAKRPRKLRRLPVHVVEDHNDALSHVYRAIGAKRLPLNGNVMIHFDSHPDLGIPKDLDSSSVFDKEKLFSKLSIENWILPAVFAGHISHVVWVMPPWSDQLPIGLDVTCHVGFCRRQNGIRIDLALPYFLEEGLWAPERDLDEKKELRLETTMLEMTSPGKDVGENPPAPPSLSFGPKSTPSSSFVLDIDLDFFTTLNPFKEMLSSKQFELLQKLYYFKFPRDGIIDEVAAKKLMQKRGDQVRTLERIFLSIPSRRDKLFRFENNELDIPDHIDADALKNLVDEIVNETPAGLLRKFESKTNDPSESISDEGDNSDSELKSFSSNSLSPEGMQEIDWEILHWGGLTCDATPLPHHVSSEEEVDRLVQETENFLTRIFRVAGEGEESTSPAVVTIARSSEDDYCPPEAVDWVQEKTLKMLEKVFDDRELCIEMHYEEDRPI